MYKLNDKALVQKMGDEMVILHMDTETYYGLDEVSSRMLEVLLESESNEDVAIQLLSEYEVDKETLCEDLEVFIADLKKKNVLIWES